MSRVVARRARGWLLMRTNTAAEDAYLDAILAGQQAEGEHPMIVRAIAARRAVFTMLDHLEEFASVASHQDLVKEISDLTELAS